MIDPSLGLNLYGVAACGFQISVHASRQSNYANQGGTNVSAQQRKWSRRDNRTSETKSDPSACCLVCGIRWRMGNRSPNRLLNYNYVLWNVTL
jgi:hypothetical protein